ncbi:hypothetical protein JCM10212_005151 [Sporobolomyces blumeae]
MLAIRSTGAHLARRPQSLARRTFASSRSRPSSSSDAPPPVVGTAPYYSRHLVIHTPHDPKTWPSHLEATSNLYKQLGKRWGADERMSNLGFGVADGARTDDATIGQGVKWDPSRTKFDEPPAGPEEVYSATLYPDFIEIPKLSLSTLADFESQYASLPPASPPRLDASPEKSDWAKSSRTHIYVCTHGSRDCRCGDLGEPLYQALVREVRRRKLGGEWKDEVGGDVRIARVAHIGGHKWAGNALVYREGQGCDWYGLLRDSDASTLIDYATAPSSDPWWSQWRGRLTVPSEEVRSAYLARSSTTTSPSTTTSKKTSRQRRELGDSVELKFVTFEGEEITVNGFEGESLMEVARRHDLPSILATCGGNCECATCHVHIPPVVPPASGSEVAMQGIRQPTPVPHLPRLPEMTDEEDEQLDFAIGADDDSRLACQIPVSKEIGDWVKRGGRIKLPRY